MTPLEQIAAICTSQANDALKLDAIAPVAKEAMAAQCSDAADAARYRWLRDAANTVATRAPIVVNTDAELKVSWSDVLIGQDLDAVLDYAIEARLSKGQG